MRVPAIVVITIALLCAFASRAPHSPLQVQWDFRHWHLGGYEKRDSTEGVDMDDGSVSGAYTILLKGCRVGPLNMFTAASQSDSQARPSKHE